MKLTVTGRKLKITEGIRDHLEAKIERHIRPWADTGDIHVALAVEKHGHFAEMVIKLKGSTIHSHEETSDLYQAIDNVVMKAEKQIKKQRERAKTVKSKKNAQVSQKK